MPGRLSPGWPPGPQFRIITELNFFCSVVNALIPTVTPAPRHRHTARPPTPSARRNYLKARPPNPHDTQKRDSELRTSMQLPGNFSKLTPMAKTDDLHRSGTPLNLRNQVLGNGAELNILRSAQGSLRPVASGINNCLRFCTMADSTPFPPSSGTIRRWSTTLDRGKLPGSTLTTSLKLQFYLDTTTHG